VNHDDIINNDVIGQYRRGLLIHRDSEAFEEHLMDCAECRALFESDVRLERGFRGMSANAIEGKRVGPRNNSIIVKLTIAAAIAALAIPTAVLYQASEAPKPQAGLPVYEFIVTRASHAQISEIRIPIHAEWYVLQFEVPESEHCCQVVIEDLDGKEVWRTGAAIENDGRFVRILVGRRYLHAGVYRIALISKRSSEGRLVEHRVAFTFEG
jgi:hypothetical protein